MSDPGYVYFFHNKTSNFVKIGFSKYNPFHRLQTIRNANPDDIQYVAAIRGTMEDEKKLHKKFKKMKVEREWFTSEVLDFLKTAEIVDVEEFSKKKEKNLFPEDPVFFTKNLVNLIGDMPLNPLATECGIPSSVLHSWVKGEVFPSSKNFHLVSRIASKFEVDLNDLFFRNLFVPTDDEIPGKSFGENLQTLMLEKNLTASKLGQSIGVSPKTVLEWVGSKGRIPRSLSHIKRLANFFKVSTHRLLFGEEDVNHLINETKGTELSKLVDHIGELSNEYELVIRKKI